MKIIVLLFLLTAPLRAQVGPLINGNQINPATAIQIATLTAVSNLFVSSNSVSTNTPAGVLSGQQVAPGKYGAIITQDGGFMNQVIIGTGTSVNYLVLHPLVGNTEPLGVFCQDNGVQDCFRLYVNGATTTYAGINPSNAGQYLRLFYFNGAALGTIWVDGQLGVGTTTVGGATITSSGTIHVLSGGLQFPDGSIQVSSAPYEYWSNFGNIVYNSTGGAVVIYPNPQSLSIPPPANLLFMVANASMTVLYNGNVGIGTTAPAYTLDVNGAQRVNGQAIVGGSLTVSGSALSVGGSTLAISAGSVGIGTTSPASELTVFNGDIRISTTTGSNGIYFEDGTRQITANQYPTALWFNVNKGGSAQTGLTQNAGTELTWPTVSSDTTGGFGSNVFTAGANTAGVWSFTAAAGVEDQAAGYICIVSIYKNGADAFDGMGGQQAVGTSTDNRCIVTGELSVSIGDTVAAYVYFTEATTKNVNGAGNETYFRGHFIGK